MPVKKGGADPTAGMIAIIALILGTGAWMKNERMNTKQNHMKGLEKALTEKFPNDEGVNKAIDSFQENDVHLATDNPTAFYEKYKEVFNNPKLGIEEYKMENILQNGEYTELVDKTADNWKKLEPTKKYDIKTTIPHTPPSKGGKRKNHKRTQKKRKPKKTKKTRGKAITFGKLMTFW